MIEGKLIASLEALHEDVKGVSKRVISIENKFDDYLRYHDNVHVVLAKSHSDDVMRLSNCVVELKTIVKARTQVISAWNTILSFVAIVLGIKVN